MGPQKAPLVLLKNFFRISVTGLAYNVSYIAFWYNFFTIPLAAQKNSKYHRQGRKLLFFINTF
jgi:hypothetical protein